MKQYNIDCYEQWNVYGIPMLFKNDSKLKRRIKIIFYILFHIPISTIILFTVGTIVAVFQHLYLESKLIIDSWKFNE